MNLNIEEQMDDAAEAAANREDRWVAGAGGMDLPFKRHGQRWQRVYNPAQLRHGYRNLDSGKIYFDFPR
jgi:hypothetical protein